VSPKIKKYFFTLMLIIAVLLAGCTKVASPNSGHSNPVQNDLSTSADNTEFDGQSDSVREGINIIVDETEYDIFEGVEGRYKNQTITMTITVSEIDWSSIWSYKAYFKFSNGYVLLQSSLQDERFMFMNKKGELLAENGYRFAYDFEADGRALVQLDNEQWVYIDTTGKILGLGSDWDKYIPESKRPVENCRHGGEDIYFYYDGDIVLDGYELQGLMDNAGNRLTEPIFKIGGNFAEGFCFVILAEGEHKNVLINKKGDIIAVLPDGDLWANVEPEGVAICRFDEPNVHYYQLYDITGKQLNEAKFDFIGYFYKGLALIVQDRRVGVIDKEGHVVIPPLFPYDESGYEIGMGRVSEFFPVSMNEDAIVIPYSGMVAILNIDRF